MQVVCDNCGATYKIPEHKLVKEVNKATCRKCGHRMLIRKPKPGTPDARAAEERRQAAAASVPREEPVRTSEWEEEEPTKIAAFDDQGEPKVPAAPSVPPPAVPAAAPADEPAPAAPSVPSARPGTPAPAAPPKAAPAPAPTPAPAPAAAPVSAARHHDPSGDMTLVAIGAVLAVVGALVLAVNVGGGAPMRFGGLFLGLWGGLIALFMVVTSARGRKPASKVLSVLLGTVFAAMGAGLITVIAGGAQALDEGMAQLQAEADRAVADAGAQGDIDALFAEEDGAADAATDGADDEEAGTDEAAAEDAAAEDAAAEDAAAEDAATDAGDDAGVGTAEAPSEPARAEPTRTESAARTAPARTEPARTQPTRAEPTRTAPASTSTARTSSSSSGSSSSGSSSSGTTSSGSGSSMSSLPPTVVDTMLKSNKSVKKCLYQEYKRADGNLSSVSMRFKVLPSGKVSSAYVTTSKYKGTELDSCLSAALYTVQFPPFQGEPLTLSWTAAAG